MPTALVIVELTSRFPEEGGLYAWSKEAFGDFHGFIAGWTYWIYTIFYFPALLLASAAMSAYVIGPRGAALAQDRGFLLAGSFVLLAVAVGLNLIGLNIGKWLQNAGGVSTYLPLLILTAVAVILWRAHGSVTHFTWANMMPTWDWGTVNFWPQIAFAFTGLELVSMMSEEVRDPRRIFPRAIFASGALIAVIYIMGTFAVLSLVPAAQVDPKSGVFQAITMGSTMLRWDFSACWRRCWFRWGMREASAARWREFRGCRLWWGLTAICQRRSEKYIRDGRRHTWRFWCRPLSPPRFCY